MATKVAVVTEKTVWNLGNDVGNFFQQTTLSDPEAYADAASAWTTQTGGTGTIRLVVTPTDDFNVIAWKFYGDDAADEVCIARFWGFTDVAGNGGVMGDYLGDVVITLGTKAIHVGASILPAGKLWAKKLLPTIDKTLFPGVRLVGEGGNAPVTMLFDGMGLKSFIVEMTMTAPTGSTADPAASAGVLWRVF